MCITLCFLSISYVKFPLLQKKNDFFHSSLKNNNIISKNYEIKRNPIIVNEYKYIPCDYDNSEQCFAYCPDESEECKIIINKSRIDNFKTFFYIILWFIFSIKYNISNKQRLIMLNLPWFQSMCSLASGSFIVLFLWLLKLRKAPLLNFNEIKTYIPISFFHSLGHITAVISMAAGAVSFTQIVKAAEPIFTCGLNWFILGDKITLNVGLSLIPIILGVSLASISELSFTWTSFIAAMFSNVAFAGRNVFSRLSLDKPKGKNITPENLFGILTLMSFLMSIPMFFIFEGSKISNVWLAKTSSTPLILRKTFETGVYFYLYNEAAMVVLNKINPISHAIINTLKRIAILMVCVIFFNTPLTRNGIIGSLIAICGSYLYAKAKRKN